MTRRTPHPPAGRRLTTAAPSPATFGGCASASPQSLTKAATIRSTKLIQDAIGVLGSLGADVREVSLPVTGAHATVAGNIITWSEEAQVHAPWVDQIQDYTEGARQKVLTGSVITSLQYHKAQQLRRMVIDEMNDVLKQVDLLVGPVGATPARAATHRPDAFIARGRLRHGDGTQLLPPL